MTVCCGRVPILPQILIRSLRFPQSGARKMKHGGHHSFNTPFGRVTFTDRQWAQALLSSSLFSATLFLAASFGLFAPDADSQFADLVSFDAPEITDAHFLDPKSNIPSSAGPYFDGSNNSIAPRIAYLISGTKGDSQRIRRTLQAIYHPRNQYILHLDMEAPPRERIDLAIYVKSEPTFSKVVNVHVLAKGNLVTYKGPTMFACTLHAIAMLLKEGAEWDWFINLSASDYPLMTQDDILHVFSSLPRNLNFIEHTQITGWKLVDRGRKIIVDPGLYLSKKFDLVQASEKRDLPSIFKLYTGSAWVMLTRSFLEYCIWGWDNLPRSILMYYVNFISSPEAYFHTVICNSEGFRDMVIGHDLHYISWDIPPKQHPLYLSSKDFNKMVKSGMPFARKFPKDDKVLDKIDSELLGRSVGRFTPGAWCVIEAEDEVDPCTWRGKDSTDFRPGPGAERLQGLMTKILSEKYRNGSCSSLTYDQPKRDWIYH